MVGVNLDREREKQEGMGRNAQVGYMEKLAMG